MEWLWNTFQWCNLNCSATNARSMGTDFCAYGRGCDRQWTLVIWIAAITLANEPGSITVLWLLPFKGLATTFPVGCCLKDAQRDWNSYAHLSKWWCSLSLRGPLVLAGFLGSCWFATCSKPNHRIAFPLVNLSDNSPPNQTKVLGMSVPAMALVTPMPAEKTCNESVLACATGHWTTNPAPCAQSCTFADACNF